MKVKLYGIHRHIGEKVLVATFDQLEQAKNYVEKAKLKKPRLDICGCCRSVFKQKSLLGDFEEYFIADLPQIPHNPTFPRFLIMKSTRARDSVTPRNAYQNRDTCERAGVKPGKIYSSKEAAKADALKLSSVNPVGFVVIQLE